MDNRQIRQYFPRQRFALYGTHVFDPKPGVCVHGLCVDG